jgi:uncharacterized delta-60 repeat protein
MHKRSTAMLALCLVLLAASITAPARSLGKSLSPHAGALDPSFSADGLVTTDFGTEAGWARSASAVLAPGGKTIVLAGTDKGFVLGRLSQDGSLDRAFGRGDGFQNGDSTAPGLWAAGAVVRPDGKILVAGGIEMEGDRGTAIAVARYSADGAVDRSFGRAGIVVIDKAPLGRGASSIVLQPDGKTILLSSAGTLE